MRPEAQERLALARQIIEDAGGDLSIARLERAHMLPAREIEFETVSGNNIVLDYSDPDRLTSVVEFLQFVLDDSMPTLRPTRVQHEPGAHGYVIDVVESDRGADVLYLNRDPSIRLQHPYVSGRWPLVRHDDGSYSIAGFVELSHCDVPQFDVGQAPAMTEPEQVAAARVVTDVTEVLAAYYSPNETPQTESEMEPEEIRSMCEEMVSAMLAPHAERIEAIASQVEAVAGMVAAMSEEAEAADEGEEPEAAAADDAPEDEAEAADDEEDEAMASKLDAALAKVEAAAKRLEVKASLIGRNVDIPDNTPSVPKAFGDRVLHFRRAGMDQAAAVTQALNPNT